MAEKKDTSGAPQHVSLAPNDEGAAPGGPSTDVPSVKAATPTPPLSDRPETVEGTAESQPAVSVPNGGEAVSTARKTCLRFLLEIIKNERAKCL